MHLVFWDFAPVSGVSWCINMRGDEGYEDCRLGGMDKKILDPAICEKQIIKIFTSFKKQYSGYKFSFFNLLFLFILNFGDTQK